MSEIPSYTKGGEGKLARDGPAAASTAGINTPGCVSSPPLSSEYATYNSVEALAFR